MRLQFEEFRTEENKDFVLIYDSGKTDPIIGFSGVKDKPRTITSSGNSIRVRFISNGENVNNGFKVSYKQTGQCRPVGIDRLSIGTEEKWTLLESPTLAIALAVFYFVTELVTFIKQFSTFGYPQLSAPAHGKIEGYRREVDSTVLLSCDQGYDIYPESSSFRTCQSNKQWSGANPICKSKKMLLPQTYISYLKHRLLTIITLLITWHLLSRPISPQLRFMID